MRPGDNSTERTTPPTNSRRRWLLGVVGGLIAATTGVGAVVRLRDNPYSDMDGDGIPDSLERSQHFHQQLQRIFDEEIEPLNPSRKDLLIDVRYIGGTSISMDAKDYLRELFRNNGIFLQWLDHPVEYDLQMVYDRYGIDTESLLVAQDGFYWNQIEPLLRNVAFQVLVVPGHRGDPDDGQLYSRFYRDHINGMNFGNRAAVAYRDEADDQAELVLHEIAHLVLCHDDDSDNLGVMGQEEEIDLTDHEWEQFRNGLHHIHDSSGLELVTRRCLLGDYRDGAV